MTDPKIRFHRDLIVWQKSMDYVDFIYHIAEKFPRTERFGLWSQLTRAAVSVPTNITEGHARFTRKDFAYFLVLARSSLMETDTLLQVALRRQYIDTEQANEGSRRLIEISKMLTSLRRKLLGGDWTQDQRKVA
jgi:four helix bundle protein